MKTSYNIFLDDFRHPYDAFRILNDSDFLKLKWVTVRSHDEFVKTITEKFTNGEWPEIISFDHDLDPEHYEIGEKDNFQTFDYSLITIPTGYQSTEWLIDFCKHSNMDLPKFKVHSQNTIGKRNITTLLEEYASSQ
jgi:hypothetical protein